MRIQQNNFVVHGCFLAAAKPCTRVKRFGCRVVEEQGVGILRLLDLAAVPPRVSAFGFRSSDLGFRAQRVEV